VVAAGAKAILDLPKTLEVLETLGVPVIAFLVFFTLLAYAMKKEYWKDVK